MPSDFRRLAAEARAAREREIAAKSEAARSERQESEELVVRAVAPLESELLPLLQKAAQDLEAEGILSARSTDFEKIGRYRHSGPRRTGQDWPSVDFMLLSAPRRSDGYQTSTDPLRFECDGDRYTMSLGPERSREPRQRIGEPTPVGDVASLLEEGVKRLLDLYFKLDPPFER